MHDISEISITLYITYQLHDKEISEMTEYKYKSSLLLLSFWLLSLPIALSNYIIKVIKLLYDIQELSIIRFAIYYLHYKNKQKSNLEYYFCYK